MGAVFLFIGVWLVMSGVKDIRLALGINDICEAEESSCAEAVYSTDELAEVNAVA